MRFHRAVAVLALIMGLPIHVAGAPADDPARDCYQSAVSGSDEPQACDLAIQVATRTGNSRAAAAAYTNRGIVLARGGRLELALKDHQEALTLEPQLADVLVNRADVLLRLGRLTDALRDYDAAAAAQPDSVVVYFNRAFVQLALGDADAAEADVARARSLLRAPVR